MCFESLRNDISIVSHDRTSHDEGYSETRDILIEQVFDILLYFNAESSLVGTKY